MRSPHPVTARRILSVALIVLTVLHVVPIGGDSDALVLGWMPWDLAYHLLWMVGAAAVVLYMTGPPWPDEPPPPSPTDTDAGEP